MNVPSHLLPTSCFVCGATESHAPDAHVFESNAEADARIAREVRGYQGTAPLLEVDGVIHSYTL